LTNSLLANRSAFVLLLALLSVVVGEAVAVADLLNAPNRGLIRGSNPSRLVFDGMEVRAVRNLSHVDDSTLRAMAKDGFAAKDINGNKLFCFAPEGR